MGKDDRDGDEKSVYSVIMDTIIGRGMCHSKLNCGGCAHVHG